MPQAQHDRRRRRILTGLATFAVLGIVWTLLTTVTQTVSAARFPSPVEFGQSFWQIAVDGYADGRLHTHFLHSIWLVLLGFSVASGFGVPLGLLMGWNRRVEAFVNPVFLLVRPIPPLAWIPLAIVWLGLGDAAKIMVIFFAAFVPAVINSYTGVRTIDPTLVEAAHTLGARGTRIARDLVLPGAASQIFTGLRLSLQASWTTLVAAELIGAIFGLGHVLNAAAQDIYPAMILVGMVGVGVAGALMTHLLAAVEARLLRWRPAVQR